MIAGNIPVAFKRALVNGIPLNPDEMVLKTIYNAKSLTVDGLWKIMPKFELSKLGITTRNQFKTKYLPNLLEKEIIKKSRAVDKPEFKHSGFSVNVKVAYKDKYPYTLMELDPLPALIKQDYIYHLLLTQDLTVPYSIFPEDFHRNLDNYASNIIYFVENQMDEFNFIWNDVKKTLPEEAIIQSEKSFFNFWKKTMNLKTEKNILKV